MTGRGLQHEAFSQHWAPLKSQQQQRTWPVCLAVLFARTKVLDDSPVTQCARSSRHPLSSFSRAASRIKQINWVIETRVMRMSVEAVVAVGGCAIWEKRSTYDNRRFCYYFDHVDGDFQSTSWETRSERTAT